MQQHSHDLDLSPEELRAIGLKLLCLVCDESLDHWDRVSAIRAYQQALEDGHRLKNRNPLELFDEILPPWSTRMYRQGGRGVQLPVSRSPLTTMDVWP